MPYVYGEFGCDMGIHEQGLRKGWNTGYSGDQRAYASDLRQAADFLAEQGTCLGACLYSLGGNQDWADFDINGDAARELASISWPAPKGKAADSIDDDKIGIDIPPADLREALFRNELARPLVDYAGASSLLRRIVADGFAATSPEFGVKVRAIGFRAQRAQDPKSNAVRVYCVRADRPDEVSFISA
jgi:hypothetical protein